MEFLRDQPTNQPGLERTLGPLAGSVARARATGDRAALARSLGLLGDGLRALGRSGDAIRALEESVELASQLGDRKMSVVNGLRLAIARQYLGDGARAEVEMREVLDGARREGTHVDFALQHLGKCLVENGKIDEGIACFEEALRLRQKAGASTLIASTALALEEARKLLS